MKKQLLTAAVSAAIVLPTLAQAGVYGRVDGVLRYNDNSFSAQVAGVSAGSGSSDNWDIGADKMRWGIVGSEDLGNGMKALYHYEYAMNTNNQGNGSTGAMESTRLAYAGLEGDWGKVTIGRNWINSYFYVWNKTDTGDAHATGSAVNNLSGNRSGNMLQYSTPNFNGFSATVDLNIDNNDTTYQNSDGIDWYEFNVQYKNGPMQIGGTYRDAELGPVNCVANACTEYDQWGIAGSYTWGDLTVEGNYGNRDTDGAFTIAFGTTGAATTITGFTGIDQDVWGIGATYKMGNTQIHGAYRDNDGDWGSNVAGLNGNLETTQWYIGVRHFLSKETRVFMEYVDTESDVSATFAGQSASANVENEMFAVGLRKDWKL